MAAARMTPLWLLLLMSPACAALAAVPPLVVLSPGGPHLLDDELRVRG